MWHEGIRSKKTSRSASIRISPNHVKGTHCVGPKRDARTAWKRERRSVSAPRRPPPFQLASIVADKHLRLRSLRALARRKKDKSSQASRRRRHAAGPLRYFLNQMQMIDIAGGVCYFAILDDAARTTLFKHYNFENKPLKAQARPPLGGGSHREDFRELYNKYSKIIRCHLQVRQRAANVASVDWRSFVERDAGEGATSGTARPLSGRRRVGTKVTDDS
ncbi:unnamed protein product [Leptosia nina]|uniref:Uncharacterized protein n=1 Tax=Leptosia nina TaxID=320188 RepID=A0AAV1J560_9NEOP